MSGYIFSELILEAFTLVASLFSGRKRVAKQGEPGREVEIWAFPKQVVLPGNLSCFAWQFNLFSDAK